MTETDRQIVIFNVGDRVRLLEPFPYLKQSLEAALTDKPKISGINPYNPVNYEGIRGFTGVVEGYIPRNRGELIVRLDRPAHERISGRTSTITRVTESPYAVVPYLPSDSNADWRKSLRDY